MFVLSYKRLSLCYSNEFCCTIFLTVARNNIAFRFPLFWLTWLSISGENDKNKRQAFFSGWLSRKYQFWKLMILSIFVDKSGQHLMAVFPIFFSSNFLSLSPLLSLLLLHFPPFSSFFISFSSAPNLFLFPLSSELCLSCRYPSLFSSSAFLFLFYLSSTFIPPPSSSP